MSIMNDFKHLERKSAQWRATCLKMAIEGRHGHLSSSLCYVDILAYLYSGWLKWDRAHCPDKFLLSKGHGCTSMYVAMADAGLIDKGELLNYAKPGAALQCHPCMHSLPQLENSSGSLGQALGIASGMALAQRRDGQQSHIVVLMGDGETNEGSVWESAMFIQAQKLNNVIAIVDYNGVQAVGNTEEISGGTDLAEKFRSFGWHSITIDGNDFEQIDAAFNECQKVKDKPKFILAKTKTGIDFMDGDVLWHYRIPSDEEYRTALELLDAEPMV